MITVSHHHRATRHIEDDSANPPCVLRCEKESGACNVLGIAETPNRMDIDQGLLFSIRYSRFVPLGKNRFRRDTIYSDSVRTGLSSQYPGKRLDSRLRRGVRNGRLGRRSPRRSRGDRNDVAGPSVLHAGQKCLNGEERGRKISVDEGLPPRGKGLGLGQGRISRFSPITNCRPKASRCQRENRRAENNHSEA